MTTLSRRHSLSVYDPHPSLSASLESLSSPRTPPPYSTTMPMPALPSQHSGFRDDVSEPALDTSEHVSHGQPPPPGWPYNGSVQASTNGSNGSSGGAWYRHNPYLPRHSNSPSPRRGSGSRGASLEDPTVQAAKVPLPKGESMSPEKERSGTPAAHGSGNGRGSGIDERLTTGSAPPVPIFSLAAPESPQKAENCVLANCLVLSIFC